jgi:hypothetical protein
VGSTGRTGRLGPRGRVIAAIGAATLLAGIAVWGVVPAGAEGESPDPRAVEAPEETTPEETTPEETTPPETTPPETAPPETTSPVDVPPAEEPPPPPEDPRELTILWDVSSFGDVEPLAVGDACQGSDGNTWESDPRADPDGECTFGNVGQGNDAAVLAQCQETFGQGVTSFYNSGTATTDGNADVFGTISSHDGGGTQLNVTLPNPNAVVDGVFVKGGNAYNAYIGVEANMIPPLVGAQKNFSDISHYLICYHVDEPETGSISVAKAIEGDVADNTSFGVTVTCDTLQAPVVLTFETPSDLGPKSVDDIPLPAACDVEETDPDGADEVEYSVNGGTPTTTPPQDIPLDSENANVSVVVTNVFDAPETGSIQVEKTAEGDVPDGATFVVEVDCEGLLPVLLTFTAPGDLGPKSVDDLPIGTQCVIEETDDDDATLVIYVPNGGTEQEPPTVTVDQTVQLVTVTNFFPSAAATGSVTVTKAVEGTPPDGATYEVQVDCTDGTSELLAFGADGGVQTVTGIQIPASCTVEETGQGGASSVSYAPPDTTFVLTIESPGRDLSVTNVFDPQTIAVAGISADRGAGASVVSTATGTLPFTGSMIAGLLKAAAWFLVLGLACLVVAYRRPARLRRTA